MGHPNETLVREFFELFSRRDVSSAARMFSDDVILHVPGRNPFSGTIHGREAWLRSLLKYVEAEGAGTRSKSTTLWEAMSMPWPF